MLFQTQGDLIVALGIAAAILLALAIAGGVIAALKAFQVRQFQDLLFKAERKIDTLERRMFNVLNAVPVALVETDNTGKFTFANKAAHQLLGRKDSELIGLRFHSATWGITYPDGRMVPPDLMPIARTLRGQTVKGFQHMLTNHGSHDKILVSVTSMPIVNSAGEVTGTSAALVELETQAGQGIDDLTGLWRGQWFAASTVAFWGIDAQGQILDVNAAALDAFGMRREDALGKNWAQVFVSDADFRAAMDYLAEALDSDEPHSHTSVQLTLKDRDGEERKNVVTAWMVRTHEGGERGLTVMAMAGAGIDAVPADAVGHASAPVISDEDVQELLDLRTAEVARAALGIGVWQYDADADAIVEDDGMQRLIGREEPGGPTLISDEGQAAADAAFTRLLSGDTDVLDLDIKVVHKDESVHWITLKGQATVADGKRQIFGVAIDTTQWKTAASTDGPIEATVITGISEEEHTAALEKAREDAREEARKQAESDKQEAVAAALAEAQASAEPVTIHEPDPVIIAENEALKAELLALRQAEPDAAETEALRTQLEDTRAELEKLQAEHGDLSHELESLRDAPAPEAQVVEKEVTVNVPDPVVVAENEQLRAELAALRTELEVVRSTHDDLNRDYHTLRDAPAPEPQVVEKEVTVTVADPAVAAENEALRGELEALRAELETIRATHDALHDDYRSLRDAPLPEPQVVEKEVSVPDPAVVAENEALKAQLDAAGAELARARSEFERAETLRNELQLQLDEIFLAPVPVPDTSEHEARIAQLEKELNAAAEAKAQVQSALDAASVRHDEVHAALSETVAQTTGLQADLARAQAEKDALQKAYDQLSAKPEPVPDYAEHDAKIAALQFELVKWQAAYHDTQARFEAAQKAIENTPRAPTVDIDALTSRLEQLQNTVNMSHEQQALLQKRLNEMNAALAHAQRFETVGRLTSDVAADFAQMLGVINNALEVMSRTPDSPDNVRRLSEAALAAGKRGERLTRQLQAFQSEEF